MKKVTILLLIAPLALMFSSCRKHDGVTVTKVINVDLDANQSYSSAVPQVGDADDIMQISSQGQHYLNSSLTVDPASGSNMFEYTPALNYVGTDEVQISNVEGQHHKGSQSHGNGMCGNGNSHHHGDATIFIYKINIKGAATTARIQ